MRIDASKASTRSVHCQRWMRRFKRLGLCVLLAVSFLAGAYAKWKHWDWFLQNKISKAFASAEAEVELLVDGEPLPAIVLDIKLKHMSHIVAHRQRALSAGFIIATDDDYVPARMIADGEAFACKVRLKGDRLAHLDTEKWSFRVKGKGDGRLWGMRNFSLQHPQTRWYLNEWAFLEAARTEGLIAVRYTFANLILNGRDMGAYAVEEHFGKELLESQGRRAGVIVAFAEPEFYHINTFERGLGGDAIRPLTDVRVQEVRAYDTSRLLENADLTAQHDAALQLLRDFQEGRRTASEVFDVDSLARYFALLDVWQAWHANLWQNSRFYYNPVTAKLEPIVFDTMAMWGQGASPMIASRPQDQLVSAPLKDPIIATAYLRELRRLSMPSYLEEIKARLEPAWKRWSQAMKPEFPFQKRLDPDWETLANRQAYIRSALKPDRLVRAYAFPTSLPGDSSNSGGLTVGSDDAIDLTVEVDNIAFLPVEVVDFKTPGGRAWAVSQFTSGNDTDSAGGPSGVGAPHLADRLILHPGAFRKPPVPVRIRLSLNRKLLDGVKGGLRGYKELMIGTRLIGQQDITYTSVRMVPPRSYATNGPDWPTIDDACAAHPFLQPDSEKLEFAIGPGAWKVEDDLVLPFGASLVVAPGTELLFEEDAILLLSGPLTMIGTTGAPIKLSPFGESWGGLVVLDAAHTSKLEHVIIQGTTSLMRGGWQTTGGVTFYRSDVELNDVTFQDALCEDALNVISAEVAMSRCSFVRCMSDAFDGDFVTAKITDSLFEKISGDALDFSGSEVTIQDVRTQGIYDKAVSAGEGTTMKVRGLSAEVVGMAIASKDRSNVDADDVVVQQAGIAFAAYQKKPEYGPAELFINKASIAEVELETLTQFGSFISLNGEAQEPTHVDIDRLYNR